MSEPRRGKRSNPRARKELDERLRASEERYRALLEASPDAMLVTDAVGRIKLANGQALAMFGYTREQLVRLKLEKLIPKRFAALHPRRMGEGRMLFARRQDGCEIPVDVSIHRAETSEGVTYTVAIRDVTAWHDLTYALQSSETKYRRILDATIEGILHTDASARTIYANAHMARMLGYTAQELVGKNVRDFTDPADHPALDAALERRRSGIVEQYECRFLRKDGQHIWALVSGAPIIDARGEFQGTVALVIDLTDRKRAEDALRTSQREFREIIQGVPVGIVIRVGDTLRFANPAFAQCLGFEPATLVGKSLGELLHSDERANVIKQARAGTIQDGPYRFRAADGHTVILEASQVRAFEFQGEHAHLSVFRDVTAQRTLETQLRIADRMAAMGRLAAGLAHEVNNPLAALLANVEHVTTLVENGDIDDVTAVVEPLVEAIEAGNRIRHVVHDLRVFSRTDEEQHGPIDVRAALDLALRLAQNEIRHRARVVRDYEDVPLVDGSESRLGQVFVNLIVNAAQAIPEGAAQHNEIRLVARSADGLVVIEIHDTGVGIPADMLPHVFEPFFTTKPVGTGTGLGLSICQKAISELGGEIRVDSRPGHTVVTVVLPSTSSEPLPPSKAVASPRTPYRARILVIDDDELVVAAVKRVLLAEHEVIALTSSEEALARLEGGESFDVIFCDLMMPQVSGIECFTRLEQKRPELLSRVVFLTGGAFTPRARAFLESTEVKAIRKPFTNEALRAAVADSLLGSRCAS